MATNTRKPRLVVYGATSYTAQQALEYLDTHPERQQFDYILAGRNKNKLETRLAGLKNAVGEVEAVKLDDEVAVGEMVKNADVVLNFAGPYRKQGGEAIIKACAEQGKHYLDLSGEAHWLSTTIIPKYHTLASKTGACIIPSAGFDCVVPDMTLYLALKTLQAKHPEASITLSTSFYSLQGTMAGGTMATTRSISEIPKKERKDGEWSLVPGVVTVDPPPHPLTSTISAYNPLTKSKLYGSFFFFYPYNRTVIRRTWYLSRLPSASQDVTTANDHSPETEPRHGEVMMYDEGLKSESWLKAFLTGLPTLWGFQSYFASGLVRGLANRFMAAPGTGPSKEELEKGWCRIVNISDTTLPNTQVVTSYYGNGDPSYLNTAWLIVESALSLVLPPPEETHLPPLASKGGVLTPSTALGGVLLERLRRSERWQLESEVVEEQN